MRMCLVWDSRPSNKLISGTRRAWASLFRFFALRLRLPRSTSSIKVRVQLRPISELHLSQIRIFPQFTNPSAQRTEEIAILTFT